MSQDRSKDHTRFRHIVKRRIKRDLRKYISERRADRRGRATRRPSRSPSRRSSCRASASAPNEGGGVGQGEGEPGDRARTARAKPGRGRRGGGPARQLEVDVSLEELAQILGEELELPNIEPKGQARTSADPSAVNRYTGSAPGRARELVAALQAHLQGGAEAPDRERAVYDPEDPVIVPIPDDMRYRAWQIEKRIPEYQRRDHLHDGRVRLDGATSRRRSCVSRPSGSIPGSGSQYKAPRDRYIVHDAAAKEVTSTRSSTCARAGGTKISARPTQLCHADHRREHGTRRASGTSTRSTSATATTGAGGDTDDVPGDPAEGAQLLPEVQRVLLRAGQVGVRVRPVQDATSTRPSGDDDRLVITTDIPDKRRHPGRPSRTSWGRAS